jgi:hypothetical protein
MLFTDKIFIPSFTEISQLLLKVEVGDRQHGHLISLLFSVLRWTVGSELFPKQSTYLQIPDKILCIEIKIMAFTFLQIHNVVWLINVPATPPPPKILLQFWPFKTFISFPFVRVHVSAFNVVTMVSYTDCLLSVSNMACRLAVSIPR